MSSSDVLDDILVIPTPTLSPRVVAVTTVEAIVVEVTLVGRLDIPSLSPRTARVEIPCSLLSVDVSGLSRIDSRLEMRFPLCGAVVISKECMSERYSNKFHESILKLT
jgi:hypothetical protein